MIKRTIRLSAGTSPGTNQGLTVTHKGKLSYTKPGGESSSMYFRTLFYVQDNLVALKRKIVK